MLQFDTLLLLLLSDRELELPDEERDEDDEEDDELEDRSPYCFFYYTVALGDRERDLDLLLYTDS